MIDSATMQQVENMHKFNNTDLRNATWCQKAVSIIEHLENKFQTALNEAYVHISDSAFKELRRSLPVTRSKLDWHAISNYKLGAELSSKQ